MRRISTDQLAFITISLVLVVVAELTLFNNGSVFLLIFGALLLFFSFRKNKRILLWPAVTLLFFAVISLWTLRLLLIGFLLFVLYRYATKKEDVMAPKDPFTRPVEQNLLIGTTASPAEGYPWQDVHIQRFIGDITLDTTDTILPPGKSVIVIQQAFGKVRILVPYEVTIQLHYSTLYGEATCLHFAPVPCINAQLHFDDGPANAKRVLVLYVTSWIGDVEVQRA